MKLFESIKKIVALTEVTPEIKKEFEMRLAEGALTRDENPVTHFCSYFFPYRISDKTVFLQAHIKAGRWLPPGGHIDPGETPALTAERETQEELNIQYVFNDPPKLLNITYIESDTRPCRMHFNIWYFFPADGLTLATVKEGEFDDARWVTVENAKTMVTDKCSLEAIDFVEKYIFQRLSS